MESYLEIMQIKSRWGNFSWQHSVIMKFCCVDADGVKNKKQKNKHSDSLLRRASSHV